MLCFGTEGYGGSWGLQHPEGSFLPGGSLGTMFVPHYRVGICGAMVWGHFGVVLPSVTHQHPLLPLPWMGSMESTKAVWLGLRISGAWEAGGAGDGQRVLGAGGAPGAEGVTGVPRYRGAWEKNHSSTVRVSIYRASGVSGIPGFRAPAGWDRLPSGRDGAVLGRVDTCGEGSGGDRTHLRLRGGSARFLRHQPAPAPAPAMGQQAGCLVPLCLLLLLLQVSLGLGWQDPAWDSAETLLVAAGPCSGPCPVLTSLSGQCGQRLCQRVSSCQPGFTTETFTLTVPRDSVAARRALGRGKDTGRTGWL